MPMQRRYGMPNWSGEHRKFAVGQLRESRRKKFSLNFAKSFRETRHHPFRRASRIGKSDEVV